MEEVDAAPVESDAGDGDGEELPVDESPGVVEPLVGAVPVVGVVVVCVVVGGAVLVVSDTVPVAPATVPVVALVVSETVPVVVWPRRAKAEGGETSANSRTPTIAVATDVPLRLSRLRIRDILSNGRLRGPFTRIRTRKTGNC